MAYLDTTAGAFRERSASSIPVTSLAVRVSEAHTADDTLTAAESGSVHILCATAGHWSVVGFTGTWTAV